VFGAAAAEFVLWPKFGNSTYCLLTLLALVDFISGIALRTRRRAVVAPAAPVPVSKPQPAAVETPRPAPAAEPAPPRPEPAPVVTPAPAAPVPPATSVAESVLLDQSAPKPTVNSPDLQPGGQPPSDTPQR
jgi:hypothetical protein